MKTEVEDSSFSFFLRVLVLVSVPYFLSLPNILKPYIYDYLVSIYLIYCAF